MMLKKRIGFIGFIMNYPFLYKAIYQTYNVLRRDFLHKPNYSALITAALSALIMWKVTNSLIGAAFITVGIFLFLALLAHLLGKFIKRSLANHGVKSGCILPRDTFTNDDNVVEMLLKDIDGTRFQFATEELSKVCGELNYEAFKRTAWHTSVEDKIQRNGSHIKQNSKSILLIKEDNGDYVGFSHILVVNKNTWSRYRDGKISDNKFPAQRICAENSTLNRDKPYGLIIFSIAMAKRLRSYSDPKSYKADIGRLLEHALNYHASVYLQTTFEQTEEVPVLFQNESGEFQKYFEESDKIEISADGARIITFTIRNHFYKKKTEVY